MYNLLPEIFVSLLAENTQFSYYKIESFFSSSYTSLEKKKKKTLLS